MRVTLVSPRFHDYWDSIGWALTGLGHEVTSIVYDQHPTLADKARRKATVDLPRLLGHDTSRAEREQVMAAVRRQAGERRTDLLLVVRGDSLDPEWVEGYRSAGARTVLWLYDELRRTAHSDQTLSRFDLIATYSRHDAARLVEDGYEAIFLPLAFDSRMAGVTRPPKSGLAQPDLVFIGARYGRREQLLLAVAESGFTVRAYGRDWSHRAIDRARTLSWHRPRLEAGPDVTRQAAAVLMARAGSVLNVHHDQDGFTMRTFEASGVGGAQIVDRSDVDQFYEPGTEVLVAVEQEEVVEAVQRLRADPRAAGSLRDAAARRTLAEHTFERRVRRLVPSC